MARPTDEDIRYAIGEMNWFLDNRSQLSEATIHHLRMVAAVRNVLKWVLDEEDDTDVSRRFSSLLSDLKAVDAMLDKAETK
jgi:hypothetical protein